MAVSVWKEAVVPKTSTASQTPGLYDDVFGTRPSSSSAISDNAKALNSMSDEQRKAFALKLKAAGYKVPTTGKKSSVLLLADAVNEAESNALVASKRLGQTITLDQYLLDEAENLADTARTPKTKTYDPYATQVIYDPTKAKSIINDVVNSLLGRDATREEVNVYSDKLKNKQSKASSRSVTSYEMIDGVRTAQTTGGLDEVQFLTNIIQKTPEYKKAQKAEEGVKKSKELGYREILSKTAMANGLDLNNFKDADQWASRVAAGEPIENFKQTIRNTAKLGLPDNVKNLVDQGIDLDTIYSPYMQTMASVLEINPDTISLNDPTLRMAIGSDKEMPLYEYQRALKQDPRWQYTNNAKEDVSSSVQKVLRDFGFMG